MKIINRRFLFDNERQDSEPWPDGDIFIVTPDPLRTSELIETARERYRCAHCRRHISVDIVDLERENGYIAVEFEWKCMNDECQHGKDYGNWPLWLHENYRKESALEVKL